MRISDWSSDVCSSDRLDQPLPQRPRFVTLYFDKVDHAGHDAGPDSVEVREAEVAVDMALARLIAGLEARDLRERVDLLVVSDPIGRASCRERGCQYG